MVLVHVSVLFIDFFFFISIILIIIIIIIDPHEFYMDLCNESCSSGWPTVLSGKIFNVGHYRQTIQPNFFIPAMLIGTIDLYHFT